MNLNISHTVTFDITDKFKEALEKISMATLAENLDTLANTTNDFITIAGELQNAINAAQAALANVATPEQLTVFDNANSSLTTVRGQLEAMQGQLANAIPPAPPTP